MLLLQEVIWRKWPLCFLKIGQEQDQRGCLMQVTFHGTGEFIQNFLSQFPEVWPDFGLGSIAMYKSGNTVFLHHKITVGRKITEDIHIQFVEGGKSKSWRPFDDTATLIAADQS